MIFLLSTYYIIPKQILTLTLLFFMLKLQSCAHLLLIMDLCAVLDSYYDNRT